MKVLQTLNVSFYLIFLFLIFIGIQLQLYAFSPHPSTPPQVNPPLSPTSNVHSSTIYNSQVLEATEVPISKRVDPKSMVYLHNGILRSREKEEAPTLSDSMDGTGEHCAK